jgi:transposase
MGFVEGIQRDQIVLTSIDDMVDEKSIARVIDKFVDTCDLEKLGFVGIQPSEMGRPPYNPAQMTKLYLYGYENTVRSSRKLELETYRNVEVMWLMGCLRPDHKTIAEFRRKNIRAIQNLFHLFVSYCNKWGLVGGKLIAIDGTKIKASNNKKQNFSKKKLEARIEQIDEYLKSLDEEDLKEGSLSSANEEKRTALTERKEKYEDYMRRLEESGENEISVVDPDARLMGNNRGGVEMAYNVQSAVDAENHLILDYEVSKNPSDQHQLGNMVKKIQRRFKLRKFTVLADKGYYNGKDLEKVKKLKVKAIVSRQKPSDPKDQPSKFHTDKFIYDSNKDVYTCPAGKTLYPHNKKNAERRNFFNKTACSSCPFLEQCSSGNGKKYRSIARTRYSKVYEETDKCFAENLELYKKRQQIVEHPFGTIKFTQMGYHFLLRTRRKVCGEVALLFLGYNLKRVKNILGFDGLMERLETISSHLSSFLQKPFLLLNSKEISPRKVIAI